MLPLGSDSLGADFPCLVLPCLALDVLLTQSRRRRPGFVKHRGARSSYRIGLLYKDTPGGHLGRYSSSGNVNGASTKQQLRFKKLKLVGSGRVSGVRPTSFLVPKVHALASI